MFNITLNYIGAMNKGPKPQPWDKLIHSVRELGPLFHGLNRKYKGPRPASTYRGYRMNVIKHKRVADATT